MFAFSVAIGIAVVLGGKPLAIGTAVGAIACMGMRRLSQKSLPRDRGTKIIAYLLIGTFAELIAHLTEASVLVAWACYVPAVLWVLFGHKQSLLLQGITLVGITALMAGHIYAALHTEYVLPFLAAWIGVLVSAFFHTV
ncbi:MAG: hypothetical protein PUB07_00400 [Clostridia bacterium]|nr:hypothetical protein [Clostridia bacterium]